MKTKVMVLLVLILQVCFLIFSLFFVPEQISTMTNGLVVLKQRCPDCAPFSPSDSGFVKLINPGDYFLAASGGIKFFAILIFVLLTTNIILLFIALIFMRKGKQFPPLSKSKIELG